MVESIMLCRFSLDLNSNKFYEVRLIEDGTVKCRYGRVGQNGLTVEYSGGKRKYDSIVKSKMSSKKGYKKVDLDIISDAEGRILGESYSKSNSIEFALSQIQCSDQESRKLIKTLAKENIHNITESTDIIYDDETGSFKTPLGVITLSSINRSYNILEELSSILGSSNYDLSLLDNDKKETLDQLNAEYFVLVPTKIKDTTNKKLLLYSIKNIEVQFSICDMLFETISTKEELIRKQKEISSHNNKNIKQVFDVSISSLVNQEEYKLINQYFEKTKNIVHGSKLENSRIKNIYNICLNSQQKPFEKSSKLLGNVEKLFHGTRVANILSILSKGLLLPDESPGRIHNSLFGKGIYFANQSTKSAQYCDGMFFAGGAKRPIIYMFLAEVVIGKAYVPEYCEKRLPKGFNSFYAKAGISGVKNDEIIIFNGEQFKLTHILEIEL